MRKTVGESHRFSFIITGCDCVILEISQMIDLIEDHFSPTWGNQKTMIVGGIVGTAIFKHAIHACMKYYDFNAILTVDGCRDYIGLLRKPMHNYIYYMDLFRTKTIPPIETIGNPFKRHVIEFEEGYVPMIEESYMNKYKAMIIHNAHLIPENMLDAIQKYFSGKILCIVDPLDLYGAEFDVPTLYDSLSKQTSMVALARSMYDIDTRAIDRKIKCEFKRIKMQKRGIGKIDSNQYITNAPNVLSQIREKQYASQFRRNQKIIVKSKSFTMLNDQNGAPITIGPGMMCSISTVSKPLMKLRIHLSTKEFYANLSYHPNRNSLYVQPANIISLEDATLHRFQSIVIVLGEEPMTNRCWYSLMKIANTISVVDY